ncbi:MAG: mannosyltransferase [Microcystis aeruginosa G13-12]|jgi:hypothetical protein|nr:mannosyltransferase [Microcystis aeruginosa SX13-01]NCR67935.1 mannosyltransferase [Microcystis aeruginosa LL11-07]NCR92037.1 mannosyltransferase [Microcystis aeruginosa G13-10]NCS15593.1 mannosyltransferase [Microcystis aeruginosa G13-12]NCS36662.1 mannosyltransferase [Microcystis aeruginosa G11-01]
MIRQLNYSRVWLLLILIFALFLRLNAAFSHPNILWPDEIFQTLEQGHRLAFGNGMIPWDFRDGIRSWLFPGILGGIMKLTAGFSEGASGYLASIKIFLSLLSLIPVWIGFSIAYESIGLAGAILTGSICAIWFEFIYFAPKAFTEVMAAYSLLMGVYLGCYGKNPPSRQRLYWTGFFYGLTTYLRFHLLPAIAIALIYQVRQKKFQQLPPLALGFIGPVLLGGALDAFTWSTPFQSIWKLIWINIFEGKFNSFGVSPWQQYFTWLALNWSWWLFPILFFCAIAARRHWILALLSLVIILSHSFLGHKEYRYIFPALPLIIILAGLGTATLVSRLSLMRGSLAGKTIVIFSSLLLWAFLSWLLAGRFNTDQTFNFGPPWQKPGYTHWQTHGGQLQAYQYLSSEKKLCGLGVKGLAWQYTGGYAYLHQDVPIYFLKDNQNFEELQPYFNYLLFNQDTAAVGDYQREKCFNGTCVYRRSNSCQVNPNYHINQYLKKAGE